MHPSDIIAAIEQEKIQFDKAFVGHGYRRRNGSVKITNMPGEGLYCLEQTFIDSYPANKDIVGQLFAAYPSLVQMVSPEMLDPERAPTQVAGKLRGEPSNGVKERVYLADYLDKGGIGWLMIVGSSFGGHLYWVTLYRKKGASPFSDSDRELFQYLVPILLLRFHRARTADASIVSLRHSGIPRLSPSELQLALLIIQGNTHRRAGVVLGIQPETVKSYLNNIRAQLKIPRDGKLTFDVLYHGTYDQSEVMAKRKLAE